MGSAVDTNLDGVPDSCQGLAIGTPFCLCAPGSPAPCGNFFAAGGWDSKPIEQLQIPRSVQDAVLWRIEHVSAAARQVLEDGMRWYASHRTQYARGDADRFTEARILYELQRWTASRAIAQLSSSRSYGASTAS